MAYQRKTEDVFLIFGKYLHNAAEEIDTVRPDYTGNKFQDCQALKVARAETKRLVQEYRIAYGAGWSIFSKKKQVPISSQS